MADDLTLAILAERIKCLEEKIIVQRDSDRMAMDKAAAVLSERLSVMYEFRAQTLGERVNLLRRDFYEVSHGVVETRLSVVERIIANIEGRFWAFAAGIPVAAAILSFGVSFIMQLFVK